MADNAQAQQPHETVRVTSVSGGVGGTYAMLEELQALAKLTEEVGASLAIIRSQCHDVVIDGDVLMSAVLNPTGVARFEATLLDAIDGPGGLTWLSAELQAHGPLLRQAAEAYRALDEGSEKVFDSIAWLTGFAGVGVGLASLPLLLGTLLNPVTGLPLIAAGSQVDWTRLLRENPALVQGIIRSLPGAVAAGQVIVRAGLAGALGPVGVALGPMVTGPIVTDVQSGAQWLGGFYPDGRPVVRPVSEVDPRNDSEVSVAYTDPQTKVTYIDTGGNVRTPPGTFDDLFNAYDYRNAEAQRETDGQIDIRVIEKNGQKVYVVDLPGTYANAPNPMPLTQHPGALNDMGTNFHTLAGENTAYSQGVAQALRDVGYEKGAPIMMVGHSQGGMVAAQFTADPALQKEFNVTHLVTAGSPIASANIPPDVKVMSFENNGDPIPKLDGRDNPARSNWTTVKIDNPQAGSLVNNHGFTNVYRPAGAYLDTNPNNDPSVEAFRDSAADQFLGGTEVKYSVKTIQREFPQ